MLMCFKGGFTQNLMYFILNSYVLAQADKNGPLKYLITIQAFIDKSE